MTETYDRPTYPATVSLRGNRGPMRVCQNPVCGTQVTQRRNGSRCCYGVCHNLKVSAHAIQVVAPRHTRRQFHSEISIKPSCASFLELRHSCHSVRIDLDFRKQVCLSPRWTAAVAPHNSRRQRCRSLGCTSRARAIGHAVPTVQAAHRLLLELPAEFPSRFHLPVFPFQ